MSTAQLRTLKSALNLTRCRSHVVQNKFTWRIKITFCFPGYDWRALNLTRCRSRVEASKCPSASQDMIGQKDPSFYVRGRRRAGSTSSVVDFHILAAMSRLLRGKIFCSYGSNFLKSHTFTKMTLRFSSQNLPRWRRFSLTSKKILQVAVVAGTMTATVCGGIIYWSSGTIDSN